MGKRINELDNLLKIALVDTYSTYPSHHILIKSWGFLFMALDTAKYASEMVMKDECGPQDVSPYYPEEGA